MLLFWRDINLKMRKIFGYFSLIEKILWLSSVFLITASFLMFDRSNYMTLIASIIGTTALIFGAKGNPAGPFLMIIFSLIYCYISYTFSYYGEMLTYVGMSMPMAIISFIAWLRNPFKGKKSEVKINSITKNEVLIMLLLSVVVTVVFYYVLAYFNTANLVPSTLSVTTSFAAVYLTFRRSPYFSLVYAANDLVLIVLWLLAAKVDSSYLSVIICFVVFFVNDIYAFYNWCKIKRLQKSS